MIPGELPQSAFRKIYLCLEPSESSSKSQNRGLLGYWSSSAMYPTAAYNASSFSLSEERSLSFYLYFLVNKDTPPPSHSLGPHPHPYHSGVNSPSPLPNLVACKLVLYNSSPFVLTTMDSDRVISFFFFFFIVNRLGMDFEFHTHLQKPHCHLHLCMANKT